MNLLGSYGRLLKNPRFAELAEINARAIDNRPFQSPDYIFRPVSAHDKAFHDLLLRFPYFGPINISVLNKVDLLALSVNDDIVAKIYFFFGPDSYEPLSVALWTELAANAPDAIVDIGAYTGLFSVIARRVNKRSPCLAFEPVPMIRARLLQNLALNRLSPTVEVEAFALSDSARLSVINVGKGLLHLDSGASLAVKPHKKSVAAEVVQTITLDQYLGATPRARISLMKIDVELHEAEALSGARETIERMRPVILCEVDRTRSFKKVCEFFTASGYVVLVIDDIACTLIAQQTPDIELKLKQLPSVFNVIAMPGENELEKVHAACDRFHRLYPVLKSRVKEAALSSI